MITLRVCLKTPKLGSMGRLVLILVAAGAYGHVAHFAQARHDAMEVAG